MSSFKMGFPQVVALLLFSVAGAQRPFNCNLTGIGEMIDLSPYDFTYLFWYLQEVIPRNPSDVGPAQHRCVGQIGTVDPVGITFTAFESWENTTTDWRYQYKAITATGFQEGNGIWRMWDWVQDINIYSGAWIMTDYKTYAVQYYCPEEANYHPQSMLIYTRNATVDPLLLDLLETIVEQRGFPRENAIKIDNTDCDFDPPPIYDDY